MQNKKRNTVVMAFCIAISLWILQLPKSNTALAQPRITNTPIPVVIPSDAPTVTPQPQGNVPTDVSPSPTFTPTEPLPNVRMVSVAAAGTGLIRDFPEDGTVIGTLENNVEYQVTGQYFSWIQFQFPAAQSGRAWVYIENVSLSGNLNEIPFIDPNSQAAQSSALDNATATAIALFQTPGFAETATADARIIEIPLDETNQASIPSDERPTYTPPAEMVALQPTRVPNTLSTPVLETNFIENTAQSIAEGDVPPFIPILGLAFFGAFGLLISLLRR